MLMAAAVTPETSVIPNSEQQQRQRTRGKTTTTATKILLLLEVPDTAARQTETPLTAELEKPETWDQRILGLWAVSLLLRMFAYRSGILSPEVFGRRFWREIAAYWALLLKILWRGSSELRVSFVSLV